MLISCDCALSGEVASVSKGKAHLHLALMQNIIRAPRGLVRDGRFEGG